MEQIVLNELNYRPVTTTNGMYKYTKLTQEVGGYDKTVTTTSTTTSKFKLPVRVLNLANSRINFTLTMYHSSQSQITHIYSNFIPFFQKLRLYNDKGTNIEVDNLHYYSNAISMSHFSNDELEKNDTFYGDVSSKTGIYEGPFLSNGLKATNIRNTTTSAATNTLAITSVVDYKEPKYTISGVVPDLATYNAAPTTTPSIVINYSIPLSVFKDTFFSYDKDIYFNELVNFEITWAPSVNYGFNLLVTQVQADGPPLANLVAAGIHDLGNASITNLELLLSVETNPDIEKQVMDKFSSGVEILFPNISSQIVTSPTASTTQNLKYVITSNEGKRIKRIIWKPFSTLTNTTSGQRSIFRFNSSCQNVATIGRKTQKFVTKINGIRTTEYDIECIGNQTGKVDDYIINKKLIENSPLSLSSDIYYFNWAWIENFGTNEPLHEQVKKNYIDGYDLKDKNTQKYKDMIYEINATTSAATFDHYICVVGLKTLNINSIGMTVEQL
jgi:hypothetical protein